MVNVPVRGVPKAASFHVPETTEPSGAIVPVMWWAGLVAVA